MSTPTDTTAIADTNTTETPTENSTSELTATTNPTENTNDIIPQDKPPENIDCDLDEKKVEIEIPEEKPADNTEETTPPADDDKKEEKQPADKKEEKSKDKPPSEIKIKLPGKYEIIKVEIKHGPLRKAVPKMPLPLALLCCILNIILPGSGTLVSAFSVFCCGKTEHENTLHGFGYNLLATFLQCISAILLIGWIWSIMWGVLFVNLALKDGKKKKEPLPTQV